MLDDTDRDTVALVIAVTEGDDDACVAIMSQYDGSVEGLSWLAYSLAKFAAQGFTEAVRYAEGIWPGEPVPDGAVPEVLRRYLAASP